MKSSLYLKFIFAYLVLAVLTVLTTTMLGPQLMENRLAREEASTLYNEATRISKTTASSLLLHGADADANARALLTLAATQGTDIRIIRPDGTLAFDSAAPVPEDGSRIEGFDYAAFGPGNYEISHFFDLYSENRLNVICPVTSVMTTRGYTAVSLPMNSIYAMRDRLLFPLRTLSIVNFLLSLMILGIFSYFVYRPLQQITAGARQLASGDFAHRIAVNTRDEMGTLADSLNYTARELQKNNDYQQKFISNISHDFRSPLTSIKGFAEAMADGTIPPEQYEKYMGIIVQETERLEKLTQSMLDLNAVNADSVALNRENFDIHKVLKNTVAVFEGSCRKKKISIDLSLTGDTMMVNADREKIEQVIYNLLDNAVKFSDRNSEIMIRSDIRHGKCQLTIKDEGCGITSEELPHIWDRFYKTDASRGRDRTGTGLGLSIVKEIMQAHKENISVTSTENVGTEFSLTLPLSES